MPKHKNIIQKEVENEIGKHPKQSILTFILLFTLLIAFIGALNQYNWTSMLVIVLVAVLICLPVVIGRLSKIDIPLPLAVFSILFIYAAIFLGEIKDYYTAFWWWDTLLHLSSGLAFGMVGFLILYILYKAGKIKTDPKMVAMFAFAFALAIGTLWEIVEFSIDRTFVTSRMQGGSLFDTMKDLITDAIGALFSAIMGYLYIKRESGIVVKPMMKEFKKDNPRFFKKRKSR